MFSTSLETLCPNSSPGYASWHPNQPFGIFTNKPLPVDNILPGDPRLLRPLRISLRAQFMGSGSQGLSASGVQPPEEMQASGTGFAQRSRSTTTYGGTVNYNRNESHQLQEYTWSTRVDLGLEKPEAYGIWVALLKRKNSKLQKQN